MNRQMKLRFQPYREWNEPSTSGNSSTHGPRRLPAGAEEWDSPTDNWGIASIAPYNGGLWRIPDTVSPSKSKFSMVFMKRMGIGVKCQLPKIGYTDLRLGILEYILDNCSLD